MRRNLEELDKIQVSQANYQKKKKKLPKDRHKVPQPIRSLVKLLQQKLDIFLLGLKMIWKRLTPRLLVVD